MSDHSLPPICQAIQDLCDRTQHHFDKITKLGAMDVLSLQALFLQGEASKMIQGGATAMAADTLNVLNTMMALQYTLGKVGRLPGYSEPNPQDYEILKDSPRILEGAANLNDQLAQLREQSGMQKEAEDIRMRADQQRWLKDAFEKTVGRTQNRNTGPGSPG